MTENKPIMIDGVDVSECNYYFKHTRVCLVKMHASGKYFNCNEWCSCDFKKLSKQLAHKTQECEEALKQLEFVRTHNTVLSSEINQLKTQKQQADQKLNG